MSPGGNRERRAAAPNWIVAVCITALLAGACGLGTTRAPLDRASAPTGKSSNEKTLRLGFREQPGVILSPGDIGGTGVAEIHHIFHAGLTIYDDAGRLQPRLAQAVPSLTAGDWKIFDDGEMEVTWRLRPDAFWHDSAPLTADDFVFGIQVALDPDLPYPKGDMALIAEALAIDPHTLVVRWKQPFAQANAADPVILLALPRHVLGELYEAGDKQAFANSSYWRGEDFVGLGPFRLTQRVLGSSMEGVAFDRYILGRPGTDRVILQYYSDRETLLANLLAGAVDVIPVGSLGAADLATIKNAWGQAGGGTALPMLQGARVLKFQFRYPGAAWLDPRVREAVARLLDREAMAQVLQYGLTVPADTEISPDDPAYSLLQRRGLVRFGFDPEQAQRLLADAGWRRQAGGPFQDTSGKPFSVEVRTRGDWLPEAEVIASQWRASGIEPTIFSIPDSSANLRELQSTFEGVLATSASTDLSSYTSAKIPTAGNGWRAGLNLGGWSDPTYDRIYGEYGGTFDGMKQLELEADLLKMIADNAVTAPLYYNVRGAAWRSEIRGPGARPSVQFVNSWNIHAWEIG